MDNDTCIFYFCTLKCFLIVLFCTCHIINILRTTRTDRVIILESIDKDVCGIAKS